MNRLANVADLKVNEPFDVAYPDADASGVLIKLGTAVDGGVGPDSDIVGFSTTYPHKGFTRSFEASDKTTESIANFNYSAAMNGSGLTWDRRPCKHNSRRPSSLCLAPR